MLNFTETAIRLYRQLFGSPELAGQLPDGIDTVLDGHTAIAVTEAGITETAVLGSSFLEQGAALAWLAEQQRVSSNFFNQRLSIQDAESARAALAVVMGLTQSGHRSTVFLDAADLSGCQDLLQNAAARKLPLVIHVSQRLSSINNSIGAGHDAVHQAMDSGCALLFASNIQEAVDYTLIARHIAEQSLVPVIVAMDGSETALSVQDVRLPSAELVKQFIGQAQDLIESPTAVQKQLFSEHRCRIPRWHDLDKPVLQGSLQNSDIAALGDSARKIYFDAHLSDILSNAFSKFAYLSGRRYSSVSEYRLKKADLVFIAQGSAVETIRTLSDIFNKQKKSADKVKIAVIGLHVLRPLNSQQLADLLNTITQVNKPIIVLERMQVPLADDGPLMRELRALLQKSSDRFNAKLHSVIYGLGGMTLNLSDLKQLCLDIKAQPDSFKGRYLGVSFTAGSSQQYPKRQVMLDTLQRYYPEMSALGIRAPLKQIEPVSAHISVAIDYGQGNEADIAYAMELSSLLYKLSKQSVRTGVSEQWYQWAGRSVDCVFQAEAPCQAGNMAGTDYTILLSPDVRALKSACQKINAQGSLFIIGSLSEQAVLKARNLFQECLSLINDKQLTLYYPETVSDRFSDWEQALALLFARLVRQERIKVKSRKIFKARKDILHIGNMEESAQEQLIELFKATYNSFSELAVFDLQLWLQKLYADTDRTALTANNLSENENTVPDMVQRFGQASERYDSLPRFWDQVGILHQSGEQDQLSADPYLSTATIPPLSATFNTMDSYRERVYANDSRVPYFDARNCTACGACWANCPDSAIATVAIHPKALIDTSIQMTGADALRQVSSKLAARMARQCRNNDIMPTHAGELMDDAFIWLREKSGLPEERLQAISANFEKASPAIAELPLVVSEQFFYAREKQQNDSGEFFSLVINPDTCKGCGLCVELCSENNEAAALSNSSEVNLSLYKKQWQIWQQTPDTSSETIEHLLKGDFASSAALMLSRHNAFSLSGGDLAEPGAGDKIALRQILAATEYHQQPLLYQFVAELERYRDELKQEINSSLSEALPTDNLEQLSVRLSDVKTRQIDLNELLDGSSPGSSDTAVDATRIRQLVNLVIELNELIWKLTEGGYGLGRSRYSLCITSESIASWAGGFPNNPFHVPVNIDVSGESAALAAGLVNGQVNDVLQAVSLMRQARAFVDSRYAKNTRHLKQLQWQDLTADEQKLCPPLLLVGGDDILANHGFSQIALLLNSYYPVKIVIFNEQDGGLLSEGLSELKLNAHADARSSLAMMAMSQRQAYVAQTSIADNSHLQTSVHELLQCRGPGLLCVYTPSPRRHGFKPEQTLAQAQRALKSRIYPLFRYNPQLEGVFGSRINLEANVDDEGLISPVLWAINEQRFKAHIRPLPASATLPVELNDWLKLSSEEQLTKTPFYLYQTDELSEPQKLEISKDFAHWILRQQQQWQTLLELAGIETPFTDYVEKCVAERLNTEHQQELDALHAEYETKIAQINAAYEQQTHTKIRNQLLNLAGFDPGKL